MPTSPQSGLAGRRQVDRSHTGDVRRPRIRLRALFCLALCAWLAGCGASHSSTSHSTDTTTAAASTPPNAPRAGILGRVLTNNELKGFTGSPTRPDTGIQSWVKDVGYPPAQLSVLDRKLKRLGFIRGVDENLSMAGTEGVSWVEQFPSPGAARSELAAELAYDKTQGPSAASYATFAVPGIPEAHGFSFLSGGQGGINIAFVKGPYYYLVGQELAPSESPHAGIANLVAASQHLYHRVSS